METLNADPRELDKFGDLAHRWWDPNSEFRPLHDINPARLAWIEQHTPLKGLHVLDVGCGGGLLTEGMAAKGAIATGIDLSERPLGVARLHLFESGLSINYREVAVETLAKELPGSFDAVTCMEMLEHVPQPQSVIQSCASLLKPSGTAYFSTLNRNPKAYLLAVLGAEYVLRLLPRGTHDYARFMRPSELVGHCRDAGLEIIEVLGLNYNPFTRKAELSQDTSVNYMVRARRPE